MMLTTNLKRRGSFLLLALLAPVQLLWAQNIVWSCSRSEPPQPVFEGIRAYRIENLSVKDDNTIAITLLDLYSAYDGEVIQMGKKKLSVCSLPAQDPLQIAAMKLLGYSPEDFLKSSKKPATQFITIPSVYEMQKCLVEHHPAIGFFQNVVENERVGPCF